MKKLLARVYTMHPLAMLAGLCLIPLTIEACLLMQDQRNNLKNHGLETFVGNWLTENVMPPVNRMASTVDGIPPMARDLIDRHATLIEDKTDARLQSIQQDAKDLGVMAVSAADQRIGEAIGPVKTAAAAVQNFQADLHPVLANAAGITGQVNNSLPLFLDCEYNPDCLFNRYQGASKAFEKAMVNFGEASKFFPAFVQTGQGTNQQVEGIATDFHHIIGQIDKRYFSPRTKKQKAMDAAEDFIRYGALVAIHWL